MNSWPSVVGLIEFFGPVSRDSLQAVDPEHLDLATERWRCQYLTTHNYVLCKEWVGARCVVSDFVPRHSEKTLISTFPIDIAGVTGLGLRGNEVSDLGSSESLENSQYQPEMLSSSKHLCEHTASPRYIRARICSR